MLKELKKYIMLDVSGYNRPKRASIMVRAQAILMFAYFLFLIPFLNISRDWRPLLAGGTFLVGYGLIFLLTYSRTFYLSNILLALCYLCQAAWYKYCLNQATCGLLFIVLSMMIVLLTSYIGIKSEMLIMAGYCVVFIMMQLLPIDAGINIPSNVDFCIVILTSIAICASSIFMMVGFGHATLYSEKKLMDYNKTILANASIDPLTNLYNRRAASQNLDELVKNYENFGEEFSVAMGDIDYFKSINDKYGHSSGDYILIKIAQILKEELKDNGFISRWGGEEFLIVFRDMNGDEALCILEKIRASIQDKIYEMSGEEVRVTMTFGLTEYCHRDGVTGTIDKADKRLYYGKEHGRNRIIY